VRISYLAAVARDAGHEKGLEYWAVLTQLEKARHTLSNDAFQQVAVAVIGDPIQAKVARQVANMMKAQRRASEASSIASGPCTSTTGYTDASQTRRPQFRRTRARCFECGDFGHFARACPRRQPYTRREPPQ
jgi:hypothetical protein